MAAMKVQTDIITSIHSKSDRTSCDNVFLKTSKTDLIVFVGYNVLHNVV